MPVEKAPTRLPRRSGQADLREAPRQVFAVARPAPRAREKEQVFEGRKVLVEGEVRSRPAHRQAARIAGELPPPCRTETEPGWGARASARIFNRVVLPLPLRPFTARKPVSAGNERPEKRGGPENDLVSCRASIVVANMPRHTSRFNVRRTESRSHRDRLDGALERGICLLYDPPDSCSTRVWRSARSEWALTGAGQLENNGSKGVLMFKRVTYVLLLAAFALSFVACGGKKEEEEEELAPKAAATTAANAPAARRRRPRRHRRPEAPRSPARWPSPARPRPRSRSRWTPTPSARGRTRSRSTRRRSWSIPTGLSSGCSCTSRKG